MLRRVTTIATTGLAILALTAIPAHADVTPTPEPPVVATPLASGADASAAFTTAFNTLAAPVLADLAGKPLLTTVVSDTGETMTVYTALNGATSLTLTAPNSPKLYARCRPAVKSQTVCFIRKGNTGKWIRTKTEQTQTDVMLSSPPTLLAAISDESVKTLDAMGASASVSQEVQAPATTLVASGSKDNNTTDPNAALAIVTTFSPGQFVWAVSDANGASASITMSAATPQSIEFPKKYTKG